MISKSTKTLFDKLSLNEKNLFSGKTEFLSPVCQNKPIKVRIEGIILTFKVSPQNYQGWGVFKAKNNKEALLLRDATLSERKNYLNLYPKFTAVIYKQDKNPYGVIVKSQYKNTILDGKIRILLAENISQFDSVTVRWDGYNFWYEEHLIIISGNLANAERMRKSINVNTKPENLDIKGITPAETNAYTLAFEDVRDKVKDRLENSLHRSGGKLIKYTDRGNSYSVTYTIGNKEYTTTVDEDLRVQSAGICLSGGDKKFDLQSLVHVIKEGERHNQIVVGDYSNYGYDGDYDYDE